MKVYINYADKKFQKQQNFALLMANCFGAFDELIGYNNLNIDKDFYEANAQILEQKRGGGYWLWKPYFIVKTLQNMKDGDYLFYSDSGAFFLKSVDNLINELKKYNQDIMAFELPLIEKQWTKKELFINMNCDKDEFKNTNQIMATFHLIKKSDFSVDFYKEYLEYGYNNINITDEFDKNIIQDEDFIEHRHDQSIFSLLYKKYRLRPFKDATQRGEFPSTYALSSDYHLEPDILHNMPNGVIFRYYKYLEKYNYVLYINRNQPPIKSLIRYIIKFCLYKLGLYKDIIA
jgi:hypothetical protein